MNNLQPNEAHLKKTFDGWVIENGNEDIIPLDPLHYVIGDDNSFTWNGIKYSAGEVITYEIRGRYVEPPDSIHCNRGGDVPTAYIIEDWERILSGLNVPLFVKYLKENFYPPKRK